MERLWLEHLRKLPFVKVRVQEPARIRGSRRAAEVIVKTQRGTHRLLLEEKRTYMTAAAAVLALHDMKLADRKATWILAAPFVGLEVGGRLTAAHVNYADDVGNCHLVLGADYVAHIEGRRQAVRHARDKGIHAQGYLVMFALLARPELLDRTVRHIAAASGVGKTTVAQMLAKLEGEGVLVQRGRRRQLIDTRRLIDRWLAAYENPVRPYLLVGRYRAPEREPDQVEARIERQMPEGLTWVWGEGAAAMRLTNYYRGPETVIHVANAPPDLDRRLGLLRARDGNIIVLRAPGEVMIEGAAPRTAHPLLIYAELMTQSDERAREAARILAEKYLAPRP